MPEDVHLWKEVADENIALTLMWHSIAVRVFIWPNFNNSIYICVLQPWH